MTGPALNIDADVLLAVRLEGAARPDGVAARLATLGVHLDPESARRCLESLATTGDLLWRRGRLSGWVLTAEGRRRGERLLADELERIGARPALEQTYERFVPLNHRVLALCTDWQVREVAGERRLNDHSDPAHDAAVIDRLGSIHLEAAAMLGPAAGAVTRFGSYEPRLAHALERVREGRGDWFTKPMMDSYHSVWFELHEQLLATLGLDRAGEAARIRAAAGASEGSR